MDGGVGGRVGGWMDGWINGWVGGWIDRKAYGIADGLLKRTESDNNKPFTFRLRLNSQRPPHSLQRLRRS